MEGAELSQGPDQFSTSACVSLERLTLDIIIADTPSCVTSSAHAFHVMVPRRGNENGTMLYCISCDPGSSRDTCPTVQRSEFSVSTSS